jgi:hypothetical protein
MIHVAHAGNKRRSKARQLRAVIAYRAGTGKRSMAANGRQASFRKFVDQTTILILIDSNIQRHKGNLILFV